MRIRTLLPVLLVTFASFAQAQTYEYWIPIGGHAPGNGGSQWRTDLGLLGTSSQSATAEVRLFGAGATPSMQVTVGPGKHVILADVGDQLHYTGFGPLRVTSDQPLAVGSRTYTEAADKSTLGQGLDGSSPADGLSSGQTAILTEFTENAAFRGNLGLFNASGSNASLTVRLFDGSSGANVATYPVLLGPYSTQQTGSVFTAKANLLNVPSGYVKVTVDSGSGVVIYGSVVDRLTNDPTTITMKRSTSGAAGSYRYWLPMAGHLAGGANSQWRTDLALLNDNAATATAQIRFYPATGEVSMTQTVPAGQQIILTDVVDVLHSSSFGPLEISSNLPLYTSSRTYSQSADGSTTGQDFELQGVTQGLSTGQSALVPQLVETSRYRSNVGILNCGTADAAVTVALYDGATGAVIASFSDTIASETVKPFNAIFKSKGGRSEVLAGYVKVTVTAGSGVFVYGSVLDNTTNDPTTIPMKRVADAVSGTMTGPELVGAIFTNMSHWTGSSIDSIAGTVASGGIDPVIDMAVNANPTIRTRIPNGFQTDFGAGYTTKEGNVVRGTTRTTFTNVVKSATQVSMDYNASCSNYVRNSKSIPDTSGTGKIDATIRADSTVKGTVTVTGAETSKPDVTTVTGTVGFDTKICKNYPTSGSLYAREAAKIAKYQFNSGCGTTSYTRTESDPKTIQPYAAGKWTLAWWHIDGCGQQWNMNDGTLNIDAAGNVTLGLVNKLTNVSLTGSGTVKPNSNYMDTIFDPQYIWNVPFTYSYTAPDSQTKSWTVSGQFEGSSYSGTLTVGGCTSTFTDLTVTWH